MFQKLEIPGSSTLRAEIRHPVLDEISVTAGYPLEALPVWSNDRTFSLEPYFGKTLTPGEGYRWHIEYRFGG